MIPLLSITLFLPLAGALLVLLFRKQSAPLIHAIGIASSSLSLAGSLFIWFRGIAPGFSQVEELSWIPSLGVSYRIGIDGISFPLLLLTTLLFCASLIFSSKIKEKAHAFVPLMLLMETACLGVFMSLDLFLFYIFFEVSLVGMYFIIARWGHEERRKASVMFFIYTLVGSLILLLCILSLYFGSHPHTFDMRTLIAHPPLAGGIASLTFLGLFLAFAIKTPLFPFHSWLPLAHTEAPTAGSVILAGVLLKLGAYGFIRFALQMVPGAFARYAPYVAVVALISAIYGAFVALAQKDIKRMVAYTSINHMGYLVLAVSAAAYTTNLTAKSLALDGAVLQMVSHGIVTGVLFLLVGALQNKTGTREMAKMSGLLAVMPVLGWMFIIAAFASLGLPGLAHFPAEFQIFLGSYQVFPLIVGLILLGLLITTGLYLRAIWKVFMGEKSSDLSNLKDLNNREMWAIIPLIALTILIGLFPNTLLSLIHETTKAIGL